jgi:hypothetical protein
VPRRRDGRRTRFGRLTRQLLRLAIAVSLGSCAQQAPPATNASGSPQTSAVPSTTPVAVVAASPSPGSAGGSAPPASLAVVAAGAPPTRVVIAALGIDLPVVSAPAGPDAYPYCNVAMYLPQLHRPGEAGATYVFAHARVGMFLPLLDESRIRDGAGMVGMRVDVFTSDDRHFVYRISQVKRHVLTLEDAIEERDAALFLQTSEGPHGTPQKLQVVATPVSVGPASHAEAHPTPHVIVCG